jgi:photosystem II stability/assembly factor-like uncharacterized protein
MQRFLDEYMISSVAFLTGALGKRAWFVGTNRGLFTASDDLQEWHDALESLGLEIEIGITGLLCLAVEKTAGLILAGCAGGILHSADGGQTWTLIPIGSPPVTVTALSAGPDGRLYAGTAEDGIFVSRDRGLSWTCWNFGLLDGHIFSLHVGSLLDDPAQIIFAGTETGIFASRNRGRSWQETSFPYDVGPVLVISSAKVEGSSLYYAGTETGALFCSTDAGETWQRMANLPVESEISACLVEGESVLIAGGNQILFSTNRGADWQNWNSIEDLPGMILTACAPDGMRANSTLLLGTSAGLARIPF